MVQMLIDLKDHAPTPVPAGIYPANIEEVKPIRTVTTDKGENEVIDIVWKITEGEFAERKVFDSYFLTEAAMFRVAIICRTLLKLERTDLPAFESTESLQEFLANALVGQNAVIEVETKMRNNQERNRIKRVTAIAG